MARCESSLVEHRQTSGAVPGGAVVSDPAHVLGFICGVHSPGLQEEHHVSHLSDHSAVGQLQVIFWVPIATTWYDEKTGLWCACVCVGVGVSATTLTPLTDEVNQIDPGYRPQFWWEPCGQMVSVCFNCLCI